MIWTINIENCKFISKELDFWTAIMIYKKVISSKVKKAKPLL